jgi:hypothetical protein
MDGLSGIQKQSNRNKGEFMKNLLGVFILLLASVSSNCYANNVIYVTPPQPVPVLQVMVYQAPAYTVMVPVVVQPVPVVEQRVVWGYPYQPMIVPVAQYGHWGYDRRCRLINNY